MDVAEPISRALSHAFVIIPVLNEQDSIARVLNDLPAVHRVIVVDNGSTDASPQIAEECGATVIAEACQGYGSACLTGIAAMRQEVESWAPERGAQVIVVFVDGDYSDHPDELPKLIEPIVDSGFDFVIGSRSLGRREAGAMPPQAVFGNWLACSLMRFFWRAKFTDLGPFRAIRYGTLESLGMQDKNFGWTIEMQIKATRRGVRTTEVPVSYRRRIGKSKISGTVSGTIRAGTKILSTIFKYRFREP